MNSSIGLYAKAIAAAIVGALGVLATAQTDGLIETTEWMSLAVTFLVGLGAVWAIPNVPESVRVYGKAVVAGVVGGLGSLGAGLSDSVLTSAEITNAVIALIVATGLVGIVPNAASSDPVTAKGRAVPIPAVVKEKIASDGETRIITEGGVITLIPRRADLDPPTPPPVAQGDNKNWPPGPSVN